jgi:cation diffusion facilitator CzcD-associated flavoprotein CzcO
MDLAEARKVQEDFWDTGGLKVIQAFKEGTRVPAVREFMEDFFRDKVRSIVKDPIKAEILEPKGYPMGAKRIALDTNYYETFNLPHVDVVNVKKTPIKSFTENGVMVGGKEYPIDVLVLATGYDAVTGPFRKMDIRGRGGIKLAERLEDGPRAYLGMSFAGFPNLLAISGPCNPALSTNVPASIEHDVEWISDLIEHCEKEGFTAVEPTQEAEDEWTEETQSKAADSVFTEADSWQFGSNVPGKPRRFLIWLGGLHMFRERCEEVSDAGYKGFTFTR